MAAHTQNLAPAASLVVGVLTFRRPGPLAALLPLLLEEAQDLAAQAPAITRIQVVVVDNDPDESARAVVSTYGDVEYHVEPRRGISFGRNRVLDAAEKADVLVFIDDDETPCPGWLRRLVEVHAHTGAAAVAGRVVSRPDGDLDPFVVEGGFLDRAHRVGVPTGTLIPRAATNNLLLDMHFVRRAGLRFDPDFGLTGGEDSLFTSRLTRSGGLLVWCDEAIVLDHVTADRMTPQYMLRRAAAMSNSSVFVELALRQNRGSRTLFRAHHGARELLRACHGGALLARSYVRPSLADRAQGRRALARSRGALRAIAGLRTVHYQAVAADDEQHSSTREGTR